MGGMTTAAALLQELRSHASDAERTKIRRHFPHDDPVIGVRMKTTFDMAKAHTVMPLAEVDALFDQPEYEARLSAVCVLDFKARNQKLTDGERRALHDLYLARHDRINSWDMVDRAAPHVVGRYLLDKSRDPLFALAGSANVYERRTAITAPLYWARFGTPAQVADLFTLAERLLDDTDVLVSKPVGIALKYAGLCDEAALRIFLDKHGTAMQRATYRYAVEKLTN
jgi:3-methyladenine DNA glycosylase AlkD